MNNESFIRVDVFGNKLWLQNGIYHRLDGPAVIYKDRYKEWRIKHIYHREDGPAIIRDDGAVEWFINNVCYKTKEDWFDALSDEAKMKCLFSEDFLNG
jgi:hypothetical protein